MQLSIKGNWQEIVAYIFCAIIIAGGYYFGTKYESAWLGRAGSIVIVCGVILATSRKHEILKVKIDNFINQYFEENFSSVMAEFEQSDGKAISPEVSKTIEKKVRNAALKDIAEALDQRRRIFKFHEVGIVIAGTLINGFGEWILNILKLP